MYTEAFVHTSSSRSIGKDTQSLGKSFWLLDWERGVSKGETGRAIRNYSVLQGAVITTQPRKVCESRSHGWIVDVLQVEPTGFVNELDVGYRRTESRVTPNVWMSYDSMELWMPLVVASLESLVQLDLRSLSDIQMEIPDVTNIEIETKGGEKKII